MEREVGKRGREEKERERERKEEGCTNKNQGLLKWRRVRQIKPHYVRG